MPCESGPSGTFPPLRPQRTDRRPTESLNIRPWTSIYSMEITSSECLSEVRSLLSCPSKITLVRSFGGNEARKFIDFLDRVSKLCAPCSSKWATEGAKYVQVLARSCLDDKLRQRGLRLVSKICEAHRIIPSSYIIQQELIHVGRVYYHGGFADVSNGEYLGSTVAIKHLRMGEGDSDRIFKVSSLNLTHYHCSAFSQRLCREIISWKHLTHPNILPLLGVSVSADPHRFRILTEWMPNGNVMQYARSNPEANRLRLVRLLVVPLRFFLLSIEDFSSLNSCLV